MVVCEQTAVNFERLLVQWLGKSVLPLSVEVACKVVVAKGGVRVVVGEYIASDRERLLEERLSCAYFP